MENVVVSLESGIKVALAPGVTPGDLTRLTGQAIKEISRLGRENKPNLIAVRSANGKLGLRLASWALPKKLGTRTPPH